MTGPVHPCCAGGMSDRVLATIDPKAASGTFVWRGVEYRGDFQTYADIFGAGGRPLGGGPVVFVEVNGGLPTAEDEELGGRYPEGMLNSNRRGLVWVGDESVDGDAVYSAGKVARGLPGVVHEGAQWPDRTGPIRVGRARARAGRAVDAARSALGRR